MKLQPTTTLLASFSFQFLPRLIKNPIRTSPDTQYDVPDVTTARPQSRDLPTRYKNGILRISSVPDPSGLRLEGPRFVSSLPAIAMRSLRRRLSYSLPRRCYTSCKQTINRLNAHNEQFVMNLSLLLLLAGCAFAFHQQGGLDWMSEADFKTVPYETSSR